MSVTVILDGEDVTQRVALVKRYMEPIEVVPTDGPSREYRPGPVKWAIVWRNHRRTPVILREREAEWYEFQREE